MLLRAGSDPRAADNGGNNALHKAMEFGITAHKKDSAKAKKNSIPPSRPSSNVVRPASCTIDIDAMYAMADRLLSQKGPSADPGSLSLLIKLLLDHGCDINAKNAKGQTPLHLACLRPLRHEEGGYETHNSSGIGALLYAGADVSLVDDIGLTPLDYLLRDKEERSSSRAELDSINHFKRATSSSFKSKMGSVKHHQSNKTSSWAVDLLKSYGAKATLVVHTSRSKGDANLVNTGKVDSTATAGLVKTELVLADGVSIVDKTKVQLSERKEMDKMVHESVGRQEDGDAEGVSLAVEGSRKLLEKRGQDAQPSEGITSQLP
jgi:hypothetical protein